MIKGLICYNEERYEKNKYFAASLRAELELLGIKTEICMENNINDYPNIEFVVMRTFSPGISQELEKKNIKVFNNSYLSKLCNDKHKTYQFFDSIGLEYLPYLLIDKNSFKTKKIHFPIVIKSRYGHGGTEVFMADNYNDIENIFNICNEDTLIAQKVANILGKDLRVYVLGGKIINSIMRVSDTDFRSNFSLGGRAYLHELTNKEKLLVDEISKNLEIDFAGIDIMYDEEKPILNEIEDIVGCRMLYSLGINAAALYSEYIYNCYKHKKIQNNASFSK
jgi:glutathione synthase/RimK-type ligase-like ATP-grasp enzyme